MELPSSRELELETLLRTRDKQLSELSDEVAHLRRSLTSQPIPSTEDPVTLPPALASLLLPHLHAALTTKPGATPASATVTAALTQRAQLLQEENDELYNILKQTETGKLKEEVRGLRKVVERLEGALRESHQVISSLSTELDKSYETLMSSARLSNTVNNKSYSKSPRTSYYSNSIPSSMDNGATTSKPPPTGPRAHKKPRLSEPQTSPPPRTNATLPPYKVHTQSHSSSRIVDSREHQPRQLPEGRARSNHVKMAEEDQRARPPSPRHERERERDRGRERERGGIKERERDRERDNHRAHRRNGNPSGNAGRGGSGRRTDRLSTSNEPAFSGDRTLAERMGL